MIVTTLYCEYRKKLLIVSVGVRRQHPVGVHPDGVLQALGVLQVAGR